jgi:hypothetical protein
MIKAITLLALVGVANAACPNSCSGHGTCGQNEVCSCYDGWGMGGAAGGDCSDRFCPYELAWVDAPDKSGSTHNYAECANRGLCDRELGQCECFPGFEGKGCGRQTCPDSCSGHGTCEYMNELTFGTVFNDYYTGDAGYRGLGVGAVSPSADNSWDADRARACVCDAGWSGINCAARMCPYGNDVMDQRLDTSDTRVSQVQTIRFNMGGRDGQGNTTSGASVADMVAKTFALTFTSKMNETFTTKPIQLTAATSAGYTTLATAVSSALSELPNQVISGVTTTVTSPASASNTSPYLLIKVTFDGASVQGRQNLLEVSTNPCADGCTPKIDGLTKLVTGTNTTSFIVESTAADYNSYECGRRGKCDYDTGLCSCFEGYTGEACASLTALV